MTEIKPNWFDRLLTRIDKRLGEWYRDLAEMRQRLEKQFDQANQKLDDSDPKGIKLSDYLKDNEDQK